MLHILSLTLALLAPSSHAKGIDPSDRGLALTLARSAYADLAYAQLHAEDRRGPEKSACKKIGQLSALYRSNAKTGLKHYENESVQKMQPFCAPKSMWERKTALLALHDEIVRLLDAEIARLKARR